MLAELPSDQLQRVLQHLSVASALKCAATCKTLHAELQRELFWRRFLRLSCAGAEAARLPVVSLGLALAKRLFQVGAGKRSLQQLLDKCVGSSSQDREEENANNVLTESACISAMEQLAGYSRYIRRGLWNIRAQLHCGCCAGRPCYWSSTGSPNSDKHEHIDFGLKHDVCIVLEMSVTPYRAHWHPAEPAYAPDTVSLQFLRNGEVYYESPQFSVVNDMVPQRFELPQPALFTGGVVRLKMTGGQKQTIDSHPDYYICISHVMLQGLPLKQFAYDEAQDEVVPALKSCSR